MTPARRYHVIGSGILCGMLAMIGACQNNGGTQAVIATCSDITAAIRLVTPLRSKLSAAEDQTVLAFLDQAHPVCGADNPQTVVDAGLTVALGNVNAIIAAHGGSQ